MNSPGGIGSVARLPGGSMWAELERLSEHGRGSSRPMFGPIRVTAATTPIGAYAEPRPALIAVAHGSRDPRSAATMSAVVADIAAARPDIDVRLAFLDLNAPSVEQVVTATAAQGHTQAVVAPLLLGSAYHARVDLPGLLAAARTAHPQLLLTQADVLGPDPRLITTVRDRTLTALGPASGAQPRHGEPLGAAANVGVVVAAVGAASAAANVRTGEVAGQLATLTGWHTEICFVTTEPSVTQAISRLRARGAERVLVAPWFLAPGRLTDRLLAATPDVAHAQVIGPDTVLTEIVWDRYDTALSDALSLSA
ncbi:sirohydrochlorin chelatase [Nocardia sp. NPDC052112]|uniref:sirohydrochlorin chelatase n=1 Tax=Nocardia sp. NPDC052112 TaxID=3155646 RepID=UPI0034320C4E